MSTPKRIRKTGSFSPASPPYYIGAKVTDTSYSPHTPTSPPHMSSATQSQQHDGTHPTNDSVTETGFIASIPAAATDGHVSFAAEEDDEGDITMRDATLIQPIAAEASAESPTSGSRPHEHRRTDHDRDGQAFDRHVQDKFSLGAGDDDKIYKLLQTRHPSIRPGPTQNLIALYGLSGIAESVRRFDPITGVKIEKNKLRKSYEGKLKSLQIAGKIKEKSKDKDQALNMPGLFRGVDHKGDLGMLSLPFENWQSQNVSGKDIQTTELDLNVLDAALKMAPGRLPDDKGHKYVALIGLEEPAKAKNLAVEKSKKSGVILSRPSAVGTPMPEANAAAIRSSRGKKRSYKDSSFVGYGEGFYDEESDMTDVDSQPLKKRKMKV